jgi:molybdopterin-binding protein
MADVNLLLKPREAAAALGVSYPTLKHWILALTPLLKSKPSAATRASRERFRTVSGRNQLVGKIVEVKISGLLAQIVLEIGDQKITSIITSDAVREMQLRKGQTAAALIKSTEVMIVRV